MTLTTLTTVNAFVQEIWSKITNDKREKNLILAPLMDRRFESESSGTPTDLIHVNGFDNFASTATSFSPGDDPITFKQAQYIGQVNIAITRHYYTAFALQHDAKTFSNVEQMGKLSSKAAYQVSLELDTYLADLVDVGSGNSGAVGTLGVTIEDDDIIEANRVLSALDVPKEDRFFVYSTDQDAEFQKVERYINNDYAKAVGSMSTGINRGPVAVIHDLQWHTSTNIEGSTAAGHDNAIFHREWVALVQVENLRTEMGFDLESDSDEFVVHNYYGAKEMRPDHLVWMKGA